MDGEKRYTVFVSSTYVDLKDQRDAVIRAIMEAGNIPLGMEAFGAANASQWQIITETIDTADYYVLILGARYGSIDSETGISFTEMEFDYAVKNNIPYLVFVMDDSVQVRPDFVDNPEKQRGFKARAIANHQAAFWKNEDELAAKVIRALSVEYRRSPRLGWVRPQAFDIAEVADEIARLSRENAELRKITSEKSPKSGRLIKDMESKTISFGASDFKYTIVVECVLKFIASSPASTRQLSIEIRRFLNVKDAMPEVDFTSEMTKYITSMGMVGTEKIVEINGNFKSSYILYTILELGREVLSDLLL